ncbi:transglutaminase family protein [Roseitranquillus sediminis]|uniref:transglutaminase family protein n=1 Tax=Roseitranquillus sediminis TaxID=2809051 RepID=UPI001D0C5241|nr:transglutaminase family protein [Roseitranquillus sediminis]MBM9594841.1 transglutaminase family protein [Roseitranquillus sediminis]
MRLSVRHRSTYRFAAPMRAVVQSHRLTPSSFEGQRVLDWRVEVEDAVFGAELTDGAGNHIRTMFMLGPVEELMVDVTGQVETADLSGVLRGHREQVPPLAYLRTTRATRSDLALTELAESAGGATPLDRAHSLAAAVSDAIRYEPGRTHEATTAAEALEAGVGVCQDHAHALIATAVIAGLPARYVTGYLLTGGGLRASGQSQSLGGMTQSQDAGGQRQEGRAAPEEQDDGEATVLAAGEASHAWAELWVEGLGWVGFDVSNRCCPDERYIRLGSGFDAADAAPIRGMAQGIGEETLDVRVAVEQVQQ